MYGGGVQYPGRSSEGMNLGSPPQAMSYFNHPSQYGQPRLTTHPSFMSSMPPASLSAASNQPLPIKVALDFSDEKSHNLFIFEQKYNMKKNDCFNLEK